MGHAAHFLRRLDRVSDAHVELSLALYRDPELLREVLSRAELPASAERVAISLEHPSEGPFVVVTREGRFVTCLGAGMRASDLPIVTRARLDAAASKVGRMRDELERVAAVAAHGVDGLGSLAFKRMQQQGPAFAREDATTLLQVAPLIEDELRSSLTAYHKSAEEILPVVATFRLDAPGALTPKQQDAVLAFGDVVWACAHLPMFVSWTSVREEQAQTGRVAPIADLALLTFRWGTFIHMTRGLWLAARGGKEALAWIKAIPPSTSYVSKRLFRELGLAALALSANKLRAEATKGLGRAPEGAPPLGPRLEELVGDLAGLARKVLADPGSAQAKFEAASRLYAARVRRRTSDVGPDELAAVPDDVARIACLSPPLSLYSDTMAEELVVTLHGLPGIVRAPPEQLFLPNEWAGPLARIRSLEDVLAWLVPYLHVHGLQTSRKPVRVEPKIGRNDPCSCGSGKKYKRCCAAGGRSTA